MAFVILVDAGKRENGNRGAFGGNFDGIVEKSQVSLGSSAVLYHILYSVIVLYGK